MNEEEAQRIIDVARHVHTLHIAIYTIALQCVCLQQYAETELEFESLTLLVEARAKLQEAKDRLNETKEKPC